MSDQKQVTSKELCAVALVLCAAVAFLLLVVMPFGIGWARILGY